MAPSFDSAFRALAMTPSKKSVKEAMSKLINAVNAIEEDEVSPV
jgi:hypothetical protein